MRTHTLLLNSIVEHKKGNVVSDMGGSKVMLSIEQGKYYDLGEIGGGIWDMMETPTEVQTIVNELTLSYEVDEDICKEQVLNFIDQLIKEELVVVS